MYYTFRRYAFTAYVSIKFYVFHSLIDVSKGNGLEIENFYENLLKTVYSVGQDKLSSPIYSSDGIYMVHVGIKATNTTAGRRFLIRLFARGYSTLNFNVKNIFFVTSPMKLRNHIKNTILLLLSNKIITQLKSSDLINLVTHKLML